MVILWCSSMGASVPASTAPSSAREQQLDATSIPYSGFDVSRLPVSHGTVFCGVPCVMCLNQAWPEDMLDVDYVESLSCTYISS